MGIYRFKLLVILCKLLSSRSIFNWLQNRTLTTEFGIIFEILNFESLWYSQTFVTAGGSLHVYLTSDFIKTSIYQYLVGHRGLSYWKYSSLYSKSHISNAFKFRIFLVSKDSSISLLRSLIKTFWWFIKTTTCH